MNYNKIYNNIIKRAKEREQSNKLTIKEIHHIVPRCKGGTDKPNNLVELTLKEHFLCHKLLIKIYPNDKRLIYALWMMSNTRKYSLNTYNKYISAKEYEQLRLLYIKSKTGTVLSEIQKQNISESTSENMKTSDIRQKCAKNKGSKWYYNKITLKTYKWRDGDKIPDMDIYSWGRPSLSVEQKLKISKTQQNKTNNIDYYIIPNSNDINTGDCIIFINEYKEYTDKYYNINIPVNWVKINKKTIKHHSIRKRLYKLLVSNDKFIKYTYRIDILNNTYNKKKQKYQCIDPLIYKILSEHLTSYNDWLNDNKIISVLNKYII